MTQSNAERARTFRRLHAGPDVLVLANAWDTASARLIENLGAKAIATTSAGVAWVHGYPDGSALPIERLVDTVTAIARVISMPLTADIEDGYSDDPDEAAANVARVVRAGAVGINIEDGTREPELLGTKIERAKRAAAELGVDLFVNARTDVYLRQLATGEAALRESVTRGRAYRAAGCDSLFVPGVIDPRDIRTLVEAVELPLNVLAWPGLPALGALQGLGVRRLSAGASIALAGWARVRAAATAFLSEGHVPAPSEPAMTSRDLNGMFRAAS